MDPEHIRSNDGHSASLYLAQLLLPVLARETREVKFTHDRDVSVPIAGKIIVGKGQALSLRICSPQVQMVGDERGRFLQQVEHVLLLRQRVLIRRQIMTPSAFWIFSRKGHGE